MALVVLEDDLPDLGRIEGLFHPMREEIDAHAADDRVQNELTSADEEMDHSVFP